MKLITTITIGLCFYTFLPAQTIQDYSLFFNQNIPYTLLKIQKNSENCTFALPNRQFDGSCNNMNENEWGSINIPFAHQVAPNYSQNGGMTGQNRPSARMISNLVCHQNEGEEMESQRGLSSMVYTFFQFIDHNITATAEGHSEYMPIAVPMNDPYFDPNGTGAQTIPFMRSQKMMDENGMPHQINLLTSWIDGAGIYGSDDFRANWLRSFSNGKLKTSENNLLPCNTISGDCADAIDTLAPFMVGNENNCGDFQRVFVAGDVRANEQPGLLSLHTLFVREHNLICDELLAQGIINDEAIYQKARRIVVGKLQSVVYQELLPALGVQLDDYHGYDSDMMPNIFSVFATAAFRLGHTMVAEDLVLVDGNCQPISGNTGCGSADNDCSCTSTTVNFNGSVGLKEAFFRPSLVTNIGIEPILKGLTAQTQQEIDAKVISGLRNFLFGAPGSGGLDLAALNIQRGRDHGLPDYNTIRQHFTGSSVTSFAEITSDADLQNALSTAYNGNINEIDAFVGLLAENHLPNASIGITLQTILKDQFTRLRECDRYFYKIDPMLSPNERQTIQQTTLSNILKRNTTINNLPIQSFYSRDCSDEQDISIIIKDVTGYPSEMIEVPILVENFKNVYQITTNINWDSTKLTFEQINNFSLSSNHLTTQISNHSIQIDWSNYQNTGQTLSDGDTLMVLLFKVIGMNEERLQVDVQPTFAASSAGSLPTFEVPIHERDGNIFIKTTPNYYHITGNVTTPKGFPIVDVEVNFLKNNQLPSYYYIQSGQTTYRKGVVYAGVDYEYDVKSLSSSIPFMSELSVLDAVLMEEHLQNSRSFENGNTYLAADLDENNQIEVEDIVILNDVLLRNAYQFPSDNYRFYSTEKYPTIVSPFDLITKRSHSNIQTFKYAENFMGVPKGQITEMDDFQKTEIPVAQNAELIQNTVLKNEMIAIPIVVQALGNVKGFQFTVTWDADILTYINSNSSLIPGFDWQDLDIKNMADGQLAVVWHSPNPISLSTNDTLMFLNFVVTGENGAVSFVDVNEVIKPILFVNEDLNLIIPNFDTYRVQVLENIVTSQNPFELTVFPNPTNHFAALQFQLDQPNQTVRVQLMSSLGQSFFNYEKNYAAGRHQLNLTNLDVPNGVYFIRFEVDGVVLTERLMVRF